MENWQNLLIGGYSLLAALLGVYSYKQSKTKNNSFGDTSLLFAAFGAFVYADMVVFALFWVLIGALTLFLQDWLLFLLIVSIFWLIRSSGETMYWFLQQFIPRRGNAPEKFRIHKIFHNDSVWFVLQIFWQCITVLTIITTLYLSKRWFEAI